MILEHYQCVLAKILYPEFKYRNPGRNSVYLDTIGMDPDRRYVQQNGICYFA